jgi:Ca2+:H+ antiporter
MYYYQMLAFATDELSCRVGQTLAGLLNATLVRSLKCSVPLVNAKLIDLQGNA